MSVSATTQVLVQDDSDEFTAKCPHCGKKTLLDWCDGEFTPIGPCRHFRGVVDEDFNVWASFADPVLESAVTPSNDDTLHKLMDGRFTI